MFLAKAAFIFGIVVTVTHAVPILSEPCADGSFSGDTANCATFYKCSYGRFVQFSCPAGLHFNSAIFVCDWPVSVNCVLSGGNACSTFICQNGGSCVLSSTGVASCNCPVGFSGTNCQTATPTCLPNPCRNGGECIQLTTGYQCFCSNGYTGANCDIAPTAAPPDSLIFSCGSNPCQNGGSCVHLTTGHLCFCATGYSGTSCELAPATNNCLSIPCQNGGTCSESTTFPGYTCRCTAGFSGNLCQTRIQCSGNFPCNNNSTCISTAAGFICVCAFGWTGQYCDIPQRCSSNQLICRNGGTCVDSPQGFRCNCPTAWSGVNCEIPCTNYPCPRFAINTFFAYPDWQDRQYVYLCNQTGLFHSMVCPGKSYNPLTFNCDVTSG